MDHKAVIDRIKQHYTQDPNVLGVFLIGSFATGTHDEHSDIDLYVVLDSPGKLSRKSLVDSGAEVEILFDTAEDIKHYLATEQGKLFRNVSSMLGSGRILLEKNQELTKLQRVAGKTLQTKTNYSDNEITMHLYSLSDFLSDAKRNVVKGQTIAFRLNTQHFIDNLMELNFKLRGSYFKKPSMIEHELLEAEPKLYNQLVQFLWANDDAMKYSVLEEIYKDITKTHPLPPNWQI